jgi:uroporphyrinogen decarboxylase
MPNFKRDLMSDTERIAGLLEGRSIDRVPFFPFIPGFSARNVGQPISVMYSDAETSFHAQLRTLEQYGFDWGPLYGYASYGTWEFGGSIKMPSSDYEQAPSHVAFPVQTEADVANLVKPDVRQAGCLPTAMEFSRLQDKFDRPISVICGGNFTIAGNICSIETLCRWMLKKPELAHSILRHATDHIVDVVSYWAEIFGSDRVIPQMWEPSAANYILSPRQFERFALPYLIESSERILAIGVKHILYHICGEQNANLPCWAQVPMGDPGLCSIGEEVDAGTAIKYFGNRCILIGNIDPKVIMGGQPDQLYSLCTETIEELKDAPRGYMLCSGCELPPNTPPHNVYVMRKAINDVGWYT